MKTNEDYEGSNINWKNLLDDCDDATGLSLSPDNLIKIIEIATKHRIVTSRAREFTLELALDKAVRYLATLDEELESDPKTWIELAKNELA